SLPLGKSGRGLPHSKTLRDHSRVQAFRRFWGAAVLCRFLELRIKLMKLSMTRRTFLGATATILSGCAVHPMTERNQIIDTHTHFYDPTRPEGVSWPPKTDSILYRPVLPEEFERIAQRYGIAGTVVVE